MTVNPFLSDLAPNSGTMTPINLGNYKSFLKIRTKNPETVWKKLQPYLDPAQEFSQTQKLVSTMNKELFAGFSQTEEYVFATLLHQLLQVKRFMFGGQIDVHHPLDFHNSVADHSVSVCAREGLPIFQKIIEDMIGADQSLQPVAEKWRGWILRTLMHDLGETIMEFTSFAEESAATTEEKEAEKKDKVKLECEIAGFYTKLALYAAIDGRQDLVQQAVLDVRALVVDEQKQRSRHSYRDTARIIRNYFAKYDFEENFPGNTPFVSAINMRHSYFMKHYSHAEDYRGVGGVGVKIGQIIDGNNTFIEHAKRGMEAGDVIPYQFAQNVRAASAYDRSEQLLKSLFTAAVDSEAQKAIAKQVAKRNYAVLIDHISIGPPVLNRADKSRESPVNILPQDKGTRTLSNARIMGLAALIVEDATAELKDDFRHAASKVYARDTISARSQMLLYAAAYANDTGREDLTLYDKPLAYAREVPEALKPLVPILAFAFENNLDLTSVEGISALRKEFRFNEDQRYVQAIHDIKNNGEALNGFFATFREWQEGYFPAYCQQNGADSVPLKRAVK
ncbi:MAG: hypothetical protein GC136_09895 [Alphaproteobacteria bacterium]|nr:hypothetical protein [Alphaproteobacteria bacterium]